MRRALTAAKASLTGVMLASSFERLRPSIVVFSVERTPSLSSGMVEAQGHPEKAVRRVGCEEEPEPWAPIPLSCVSSGQRRRFLVVSAAVLFEDRCDWLITQSVCLPATHLPSRMAEEMIHVYLLTAGAMVWS